jgi:hypothetical protein
MEINWKTDFLIFLTNYTILELFDHYKSLFIRLIINHSKTTNQNESDWENTKYRSEQFKSKQTTEIF